MIRALKYTELAMESWNCASGKRDFLKRKIISYLDLMNRYFCKIVMNKKNHSAATAKHN
jgi:hypothetical protein